MKTDFWGELKMHVISPEFLFYTAQKKQKRAQFSRKQDLPIKRSILAAVLQIPSKIKC